MKSSKTKLAALPQTPGFPTINSLRPNSQKIEPDVKSPKRGKLFAKSRDTREDRGTREMKSVHNAQTFSHGR